jgi:catabolite repression HPr-like protein
MISREIQIQIPSGMEASPVAFLVQTANQFSSNIYLETGNKSVNAKSIMGMMSVGMNYEDKIKITADGDDEEEAVKAIEKFLSHK